MLGHCSHFTGGYRSVGAATATYWYNPSTQQLERRAEWELPIGAGGYALSSRDRLFFIAGPYSREFTPGDPAGQVWTTLTFTPPSTYHPVLLDWEYYAKI